MCTSFKLMSHIYENSEKDGQLLVDHLKGVTEIAINEAKEKGINEEEILNVIKIICMCHDFGKGSNYFQEYLHEKRNDELKQHGEISAYFTYYMLPEKWKLIGFMAVKRHHGDIDEVDPIFFSCTNEEKLIKISKSIKENKEELENIYEFKLDDFFTKIEDKTLFEEVEEAFLFKEDAKTIKEQEEKFIWFQYLWSLLLTGDKSQLIKGAGFVNSSRLNEDLTKKYKDNLREKLIKKMPEITKSPLFRIRENIYESTKESINKLDLDNDKILSINVPTGTGKTVSVYGVAFNLYDRLKNEKNIKANIIYSVPFTSVIDQNYDVLEEILKFNNHDVSSNSILKHHSMTPLNYEDSVEEKEYKNYDARFLVENWQSTIITTTFVQLFNTIFKCGENSIMHRFHRLAGSIIILDEVQATPPKYYTIIEDLFKILCEKFNCYVITVTATKPLFLLGKELVLDNDLIFDNMNRIIFENHTDEALELDEFEKIVKKDIEKNDNKSFLIILNTVKSTRRVFDYLKEEFKNKCNIIYLSTEIIPLLRLKIIKEIKDSKEKYILVSTQLVEAGVDLDFDIVYRDIAPMDCINQSAGRANRNGVNGKGIVKIYKLLDENKKIFARHIYSKPLIDATLKILMGKKYIEEKELWTINNYYFNELNKLTENKRKEEYEKYCEYIKKFKFKDIRDFKLIEKKENKEDVFIRYDNNAEKNIEIIESSDEYQEIVNAWRELNKYRIAVDKNKVRDIGCKIKGYTFLNKEDYDENTGVIERNIVII